MEPEESLFFPYPQAVWPSMPGLHTRRHFQEKMIAEAESPSPRDESWLQAPWSGAGFMLFGLDHMELLQSLHGESVLDLALEHVAALLLGHTRAEDMVIRWGESELLIFLPRIERSMLPAVERKIRGALRSQIFPLGDSKATVLSVSVGTSFLQSAEQGRGADAWREVVAAAEAALAVTRRVAWRAPRPATA